MLLSVAAGIVLGIGIGFRMDLLIFIPAVLFTLLVFTPSGVSKEFGVRSSACLAFIVCFTATGWPILSSFSSGGNTFHVILLGLMSPFDLPLNIEPSSVYEWGYLYHDLYISHVVNSYAHRILGVSVPLNLATSAYDQAGLSVYLEILKQFPADIVARVLAAAASIIHIGGIYLGSWYSVLCVTVMLVTLIVVTAIELRLSLFILCAILFLAGYPSLQFQVRHYFHLQIVSLFFWVLPPILFGIKGFSFLKNKKAHMSLI